MTILNTIRLVIFVTAFCFSIIVLGILAYFTNITTQAGFYYQSFALGIATAVLTFVLILTSLIIDKLRRGAITSLVMFELAWVGLLWVLWLATAAAITDLSIFNSNCAYFNSTIESTCHQYQAVQAFSFLNWLILFGWWVALLVMSIHAASNGITGVWKTPVTEHPGWSKNATSPYGQNTTTYPTAAPTTAEYGMPAPGQPAGYPQQRQHGTPPPQQGYPAPQQGYPTPQQGYPTPQQGYAQPQQSYGTPPVTQHQQYGSAPGSPYQQPHQQPGYAGQPAQPYPAYPQPQA